MARPLELILRGALLFVLVAFITCLTPVIVARLLKGMHMPQNIQYQKTV